MHKRTTSPVAIGPLSLPVRWSTRQRLSISSSALCTGSVNRRLRRGSRLAGRSVGRPRYGFVHICSTSAGAPSRREDSVEVLCACVCAVFARSQTICPRGPAKSDIGQFASVRPTSSVRRSLFAESIIAAGARARRKDPDRKRRRGHAHFRPARPERAETAGVSHFAEAWRMRKLPSVCFGSSAAALMRYNIISRLSVFL